MDSGGSNPVDNFYNSQFQDKTTNHHSLISPGACRMHNIIIVTETNLGDDEIE